MSRSGRDEPPEGRRADARFRREALAALAAIVALTLGSIFLHSEAGWRWLALSESRRDLVAGLTGSVRQLDGKAVVGSSRGRRHTARLPLLVLEPGETYLLTARAGPGGTFTIQGFERRSKEGVHLHFPYRRKPETYGRRIGFGPRRAELRLTLVLAGPGPLVIERLELRRISPLAVPLREALPWLGWMVALAFAWRYRRRLWRGLRRPRAVDDGVVAGILFVLTMTIFLAAPVQQLMDARLSTLVSHSLIHDGSLAISGETVPDDYGGYRLLEIDGRLYHYAYTAVAVLNTPFVWLFEWLGVSPVEGGLYDAAAEIGILRWIAALLAAVLVALLYRLARLWLEPPPAIALTLAFAFGTQIVSTVSRPYWSHAWAVVLSCGAIYLLLAPRHRHRLGAVLVAALLLLAACLCRPVLAISAVGAVGLCWLRPRSRQRIVLLGLAALAAAAWLLLLVSGIVPGPIAGAEKIYVSVPSIGDARYLTTGFLGTLVSPARGLFLYVPLVAWIAWVTAWRWRRLPSRGVAGIAVGVVAVHWGALVATGVWADGQAFGPRLFSDVVVWFHLLGALALRSVLDRSPGRRRRLQLGAAVILAGLSIFVHLRGATSPATWHWHWLERRPGWMIAGEPPRLLPPRVWNWRNPQFLAGILPPEPGFAERREGLAEDQEF